MYETTFEKEVYSDLYGERGVLIGGIREGIPLVHQGIAHASVTVTSRLAFLC
jgi:ketol-acid reductoisomerase